MLRDKKPDISESESSDDKKIKKTGGLTVKDWIAMVLSILAFLISTGSVYLNTIRVEDRLDIVVRHAELASAQLGEPQEALVRVSGAPEVEVGLINLGNRPVAILDLDFVVVTPRQGDGSEECSYNEFVSKNFPNHSVAFATTFKSAIVKEHDIVTAKVHITGASDSQSGYGVYVEKKDKQTFTYGVERDIDATNHIDLKTCVRAELVTPASSTALTREVVVLTYSNWYSDESSKPIKGERTLLNNTSTIFKHASVFN